MTSVLYDVPGPKAIARNKILGVATIIVVAAIIGFIVYRLFVTGQFSAAKWQIFQYPKVWQDIGLALGRTMVAFAAAAVGALILGFILAIARLSDHKFIRVPAIGIIEIFRAIPVLILMMLLYYGMPTIGVSMSPYVAVVIALVIYNGSVLSEVIRAGVESLSKGQGEAGYAIGLRKSGVMSLVLLPQAIRSMMPVIIAQLVVTLKDTALGFIITYNELLYQARFLMSQQGNPIIPSIIVVGTIYIVLCILLSWLATVVQKRTERSRAVVNAPAPTAALLHETTNTELFAAQKVDLDASERDALNEEDQKPKP
ncbi:amino acid ABC transporter permease [Humidisolicoccus flavus]|uniref:amino acid ABC transporter permease n=1 Tax=Humidisolicoccus flavus TaxID=3111414 RepID=UPI00324699AC